uniref:Secreted protein n=1 Tax=Heterorhabditis bacteriophora TaxID=37862 RepID=A0A1I7WT19_HETBA
MEQGAKRKNRCTGYRLLMIAANCAFIVDVTSFVGVQVYKRTIIFFYILKLVRKFNNLTKAGGGNLPACPVIAMKMWAERDGIQCRREGSARGKGVKIREHNNLPGVAPQQGNIAYIII